MKKYVTDGASLPKPIRWIVIRLYPAWVIDAIDRSGYIHDWDVDFGVDLHVARQIFSINLYERGIDNSRASLVILRSIIIFGLFIYDICPPKIKSLLRKTVKGSEKVVDIQKVAHQFEHRG